MSDKEVDDLTYSILYRIDLEAKYKDSIHDLRMNYLGLKAYADIKKLITDALHKQCVAHKHLRKSKKA